MARRGVTIFGAVAAAVAALALLGSGPVGAAVQASATAASDAPASSSAEAAPVDGVRAGVIPPYHPGALQPATVSGRLPYQGGPVVTGPPKVYVVYWGSQWGTSSVDGSGYVHLTGDTAGMAPAQQKFFAGLGTNKESWSGVMTQGCQGISVGAYDCPANTAHVGFPSGGALAGVWTDTASAMPTNATYAQLAAEANNAAAHFGITTAAANANVQFVITSPPGTHPDGFNNPLTYCAWHTATWLTVGAQDGYLMFTNMPYLPDVGASCGKNYVNSGSAGNLDGVTIVGGHEYAETITDPVPPTGWYDKSTVANNNGETENADKCAWSKGPAGNVSLATGTYAVSSNYGNDANSGAGGCQLGHTRIGTPRAPTIGSATGGSGQATVTWAAPADTGGYPVTGYKVTPYIGAAPQTPVTFNSTATSQTVTGLSNGTTYTFTVAAVTAVGTGDASAASNAVTTAGVPGAPTVTGATAGSHQATLSWNAPADDGGSPITGYTVTPFIGGTAQTPVPFASTATTQTVTGLANGTAYTFTVTATNALGSGPASAPSDPVTPQPATTLSGSVHDASTAAALQGIRIRAYTPGGTLAGEAYSAADGSWSLGGLAEGDYAVQFADTAKHVYPLEYWHDAASLATSTLVPTGTSTIDAQLDGPASTASLHGTVVKAADNSVLAGIRVRVFTSARALAGATYTGADGTWNLSGLAAGDYYVQFADPVNKAYDPEYWQDSKTFDTATTVHTGAAAFTARLGPEAGQSQSISGSAVDDATSAGLVGIRVRAYTLAGALAGQTYTGTGGAWSLGGLAAGSYAIQFADTANHVYVLEYWQDARLLLDATPVPTGTTGITARLGDGTPPPATADLSGSAVDAATSQALSGIRVSAYTLAGTLAGITYTNLDGSWALSGLADGSYWIQFADKANHVYALEYWHDAPTTATATPVAKGTSGLVAQLDSTL